MHAATAVTVDMAVGMVRDDRRNHGRQRCWW
jgi:hypothetical protein